MTRPGMERSSTGSDSIKGLSAPYIPTRRPAFISRVKVEFRTPMRGRRITGNASGPALDLWDPKGDGLTVIRAAYGIFFDFPHMHQYGGKRDTAPKGASIVVNSPSMDDPWASFPGGNPFPIALDKNSTFPLNGVYTVFPFDLKKPYINQWNLSIQKQIGANWLVAG